MDFITAMNPVFTIFRCFGLFYYDLKTFQRSRFFFPYCIFYRVLHFLLFCFGIYCLVEFYCRRDKNVECNLIFQVPYFFLECSFLFLAFFGSVYLLVHNSEIFKYFLLTRSNFQILNYYKLKDLYRFNILQLILIYGSLIVFEVSNVNYQIVQMREFPERTYKLIFELFGFLITDFGYTSILCLNITIFNLIRVTYQALNKKIITELKCTSNKIDFVKCLKVLRSIDSKTKDYLKWFAKIYGPFSLTIISFIFIQIVFNVSQLIEMKVSHKFISTMGWLILNISEVVVIVVFAKLASLEVCILLHCIVLLALLHFEYCIA